MTKVLYIKSVRKVLQHKKELETKLNVDIRVKGTITTIVGKQIDEYFASRVLEALDYPFLVEDALLLKTDDYLLEIIHIKDHTKRNDLDVIKGRIIGKKGKTLKVLGDLTNSIVAVRDNEVAIIANVKNIKEAQQAVISLIKGSKQGNVYATLERANSKKRRVHS